MLNKPKYTKKDLIARELKKENFDITQYTKTKLTQLLKRRFNATGRTVDGVIKLMTNE